MKRKILLLAIITILVLAMSAPSALAKAPAKHRVVITATAILKETGKSGVNGTAFLRFHRRTGNTTVRIRVRGLVPRSSHVAHIHANSCDGPIVFTLNNVVANRRGIGFSRTVIKSPINTRIWFINVHRDPTLPSPGITCGKVRARTVIFVRR